MNHATLTKYATGATDYSPPRRDKDGGAFYVVSICDPSAPRTFRLLAERPTDQDMDALEALHSTVLAQSDVQSADAAVLTVLMRDAAFEAY